MRKISILLLLASVRIFAADVASDFTEHIGALAGERHGIPVRLRGNQTATTSATFQPPLEVIVEAKTNSLDLVTEFGGVTVKLNPDHQPKTGPKALVVGGRALRAGPNERDKGEIPTGKYVVIRWAITKDHFSFSVDGVERFASKYTYWTTPSPFTVSTGSNSEVMVKSIKVRSLPAQ